MHQCLRVHDENVTKLVDAGIPSLLGNFMNGVLRACDEVCGVSE